MKRERLVDFLLAGTAAAVMLAALLFVFVGPVGTAWVTGDPPRVARVVELYTQNRHVLKLAKAGDVQQGTQLEAELLELEERTLPEVGEAPIVWARLRVQSKQWKDAPPISYGGELVPGSEYHFYGKGYKIVGWILKVE